MVKLVDQAIKNGGRQGLPGKKTLCFSAMQVTILMKICKWQVAASHFKMKWRKRSMLLQLHLSNEKRAPGCLWYVDTPLKGSIYIICIYIICIYIYICTYIYT